MSVLLSLLRTLRTSAHSRAALQLEVLALRHQLQVLQRTRLRRVRLAPSSPELDEMGFLVATGHSTHGSPSGRPKPLATRQESSWRDSKLHFFSGASVHR